MAAAPADQPAAALLDQLAARLGGRAPGAVIFGEPVVRQGVTVIPVARIVGFSLGGDAGREPGEDGLPSGVEARPLGFIEIKDGSTRFRPIRGPWLNVVAPLTGGLLAAAAGAAGTVILRRLAHGGKR
ncbi:MULTISPECIES: GerW family sporulation protein [Streptomyces]|uniref:GerW family sporulation protein n=1 Tax=Streptomyces TaxID=1883 RepID=UPI00345BD74F